MSNSSGAQSAGPEARKEQRITFDLYFALVYIFALHGSSVLKIMVILSTNYAIAKQLKREHLPVATWVFNTGIMFANELCKGYSYVAFVGLFTPNPSHPGKADGQPSNTNWGSYMDSYGGLIPRWEILFNITVLRLISFNLDYYWSLSPTNSSPLEVRSPSSYKSYFS